MSSDGDSSLLADAKFRNDISDLKQLLENIHFCYDDIKDDLEQASQSSNVELVEMLVEANDDHIRKCTYYIFWRMHLQFSRFFTRNTVNL